MQHIDPETADACAPMRNKRDVAVRKCEELEQRIENMVSQHTAAIQV